MLPFLQCGNRIDMCKNDIIRRRISTSLVKADNDCSHCYFILFLVDACMTRETELINE